VEKHIENTWFTWIGGTQDDSVFYYRIQSPVILVEFDHQRPANLSSFAKDPKIPTQQHIHCVVRTPNGNDYGKDLLRQHYLAHPHETYIAARVPSDWAPMVFSVLSVPPPCSLC
jgi:hypothetical protein